MPKIYDNIDLNFEDGLREHLNAADRVDYCVGYFNLRGWRGVCEEIDRLKGMDVDENGAVRHRCCRLLVGMLKSPKELLHDEFKDPDSLQMDNEGANKYRKKLALDFAEQLTVGTPSQQDETVLQKLLAQLKNGKVAVKLFLAHQLHAKLYLAHCGGNITPRLGLLGSSNFTFSGLRAQGELNIDVIEQDAAGKLDKWFNDRWNDRWCVDITKELIAVLEQSWVRVEKIPPYHIYLKMAYHISQEARAGLAEFNVPEIFREELLDFQQNAVRIAAHHMHKRQGVIIGDVVGLGKTITASAVAKIMEEDLNYNTLILCPKNLVPMWEHYRDKYDLRAKVLSQGLIISHMPKLKRYRLIIIDESHNFRNSESRRYRALKDYIVQNDSDVILLSATPYNKSFYDLASQLKLFLPEDLNLGITPEKYVESLGGGARFYAKHTNTDIKTIKAFEKSEYTDDWRELMKLYLVRRTRSFIKNNYADTDKQNGRKYLTFADGRRACFPDRIPRKVEFGLDAKNENDQYAKLYDMETVDRINGMVLPRYGLQLYRDENFNAQLNQKERIILDNLSRAGKRVMGFCRTNLYKRLESSGYAFLLSVSRHILRNYVFIHALNNGLKLPVAGQSADIDLLEDADEDNDFGLNLNFDRTAADYENLGSEYYELFKNNDMKNRFDWITGEAFKKKTLLEHLRKDSETLLEILARIKIWEPENDRKLIALNNLAAERHRDEKILIFTQFADTAEYIFKYLEKKGLTEAGLVVGGSNNITGLVERFSPMSNERPDIRGTPAELRVLVTTDVLSEGQNLQDAHIILNFDLPWALVRLIQRAGRVDRLGQMSEEIKCYSFLPEEGIEKIINLRSKLKTRINQNAEVIGSDEVFFDGDPVNIADLYSEKSGIFDEQEDSEVDLASDAYQIWKNAIDKHPELKQKIEAMPNVVYSAKGNDNTEFPENGVIVYAKTGSGGDAMLLLDENGRVVTQSQPKILKVAECAIDTPPLTKLPNHHELVRRGVDIVSRENAGAGGTLGRKNGIRYRAYAKLEKFIDAMPMFATDILKKTMNDIFRYSLRESAIDTLSRQLKAGISDIDFADLAVSLKESDKLCNITDDVDLKAAQIICSLSLIKEN